MKSFFHLFKLSYDEVFGRKGTLGIVNLGITAMLIAVSMIIESMTIEVAFFKINFAFLAIAAIGMLMGPTVGFFAGGLCDVVGFLVHPSQGFLPVYVLIACLQGLIYGLVLYRKCGYDNKTEREKGVMLFVRLVIARLLDVAIINLLLNTGANLYYGFIPAASYSAAVSARLIKNLLELAADIPLLAVIMPVVLMVYNRIANKYEKNRIEGL